jgi:hypothetical protein
VNCGRCNSRWTIIASAIDHPGRWSQWEANTAELIVTEIDCDEREPDWNKMQRKTIASESDTME